MLTLFRVLSVLPLWLLHGLGWGLGWLTFLASPTYRQRFRTNAALAGLSAADVHAAVGHAGRQIAELPRLWFGASVPVQWEGDAILDEVHRNGKSLLLLTPHLGCFEITAQAYAERYHAARGDVTVLYRPARKRWLHALVEGARNRPGLVAVPTTLAGVRQLLKALKLRKTVGLLPDQVPPKGLGVWAPFFGRDAYTMTLSARLAQQTDAAVVLLWGERLPWGRGYVVHARELGVALAPDAAESARQINASMERLIRECPGQYLWGYARYKKPKEAS